MKRTLFFLWLTGILSLASCTRQQELPAPQRSTGQTTSSSRVTSAAEKQDNVPAKARDVLRHVRETGQPPEGYVGGRVFENRERNLPPGGDYHEYDVNPKVNGKNRGPERLVIDRASGKAWFTPDHYRTFIPIK